MKPSEVLRKARELISEPERWTQHDYAYDEKGKSLPGWSYSAVCWCSLGAINRAAGAPLSRIPESVYIYLKAGAGIDEKYYTYIGLWNDASDRTHSEVLEAFDKAIKMAEENNE